MWFLFSRTVENLKWDENDYLPARTRDAPAAVGLDRNICSQAVQVIAEKNILYKNTLQQLNYLEWLVNLISVVYLTRSSIRLVMELARISWVSLLLCKI